MKKLLSSLLIITILIGSSVFASADVSTLTEPANEIVSCYYISTASLLALGCDESNLIGIEKKADSRPLYQICAPYLLTVPAVGSGKEVNLEEILLLNPDLAVLPQKLQDEALRLNELGISAVTVNPESTQGFQDCIRLLGSLTGREQQAKDLLVYLSDIQQNLDEKLSGVSPVSVYISAESSVFITYPNGMFQNDLISSAGGINVAGEVFGNAKVTIDPEQLLKWDPDYIIIVSGADYTPEDVLNDPQLSELSAVKNKNVYAMPSGIESWDVPSPSSILGTVFVAGLLHPEQISHEDVIRTAADFYQNFYGFTPTEAQLGLTAE